MSGPVVVVGGINLDTLARISASTDRGSSNPGHTVTAPGGVGRNIAENLARLGTPVRLVGSVGSDHAGDLLLAGLDQVGVDATGVRRRDNLATGTYTAVLASDGSLDVGVADMAATDSVGPEQIESATLDGASWLVLDGNLSRSTVGRCLDLARSAGVPVVLDPVGVAKAARLGSISGLHTFTPNAEELAAWSGLDEPAAVAAAHAERVEVVWLRAGAAGSTLHRAGQEPIRVRLPEAPVTDVTGAGDAMLAAYVHWLRAGASIEESAWLAAAAAWLTVGSPSAVRPDLTEALVARTLEELRAP
ncbi:MAG TPA: PfkB family carbohydrate kinase [Marmoricola sp.]|jgi:pseudouridine kinase|nr:PfkB family carbohydrate kinase [Marmoricola sp.]